MPDDRPYLSGDPRGLPIAQALAGLPLESPIASAWPALARRIAPAPRRASRWPLALAASAVIGLSVFLLPKQASTPSGTAATTVAGSVATSAAPGQLAALMSESAQLERLVAAANDDGASSASAAALSIALEDSLKGVDGELAASTDAAQQLSLWQQRVDLLRDVARIETSRHYLAAEGENLDVALVAAY
jgi:hypothetical protein